MKTRICIAEDVQLFRDGLVNLINQQDDMEVVGEADDGLEILTLVRDLKPDLILMDINMPICDGIEATGLVREILPEVIIVMLTALDDEEKLLEAIKAGADGYLLKSSSSAGFLRSIRGALDGEAVLPRKLAARLVEDYAAVSSQLQQGVAAGKSPTMTFREVEVLRLIGEGLTNQEIADELTLSLYTVKSHVRSILEKMGAKNRWEAAAIAKERGLIRSNPSDASMR